MSLRKRKKNILPNFSSIQFFVDCEGNVYRLFKKTLELKENKKAADILALQPYLTKERGRQNTTLTEGIASPKLDAMLKPTDLFLARQNLRGKCHFQSQSETGVQVDLYYCVEMNTRLNLDSLVYLVNQIGSVLI